MHRQSTWATGPLSFSPVWNSQYFKSGFLKQSASLDHLFVCSSTLSLPPTNWEKNPEYKSLSLNISLAFSNSLWPRVNPVLTLAHVGSWPTAGKPWPKYEMLVGLPLRGDLTAFCGCGAALERMLWPANHEMLCFIHIREFVPGSLRNKAHTAQKWGFYISSWSALTLGDLKIFSSLFHFCPEMAPILRWDNFFVMAVTWHWLDVAPQKKKRDVRKKKERCQKKTQIKRENNFFRRAVYILDVLWEKYLQSWK